MISHDNPDEDIRRRNLLVDPNLVDAVLARNAHTSVGWPVKNETAFYQYLGRLVRALGAISDAVNSITYSGIGDVYKRRRRVNRLVNGLYHTLQLHPTWGLNALFNELDHDQDDQLILIALVGEELGHMSADDDLFTGGGLARCVSDNLDEVPGNLLRLSSRRLLLQSELIQPCNGASEALADDPRSIEKTEFELTEKAIKLLGIDKKILKKRSGKYEVREARIGLQQLVLSDDVQQSLRMVLSQAKHNKTIVEDWGIADLVPYGRGVILLFSGTPGTGKTACAEALAHELKQPFMAANYAEIQNCFVGMTEKNIVRVFREARSHNAVLFWDEADAMFYDRDSASRNWEVRDVNVLLQEIEKFEGVCVLATNRKITLDKALERRISLKVEFDRPDRAMRQQIWKKLLPKKMPLADDVDINRLAAHDLSGGEIKNVLLNAARLAVDKDACSSVPMTCFLQAIEMEIGGKWNDSGKASIGFVRA